ncbi:MAG TPA: type III secretion HpaP family protein [Ramlibacter sp.]|uniref:type III secretion HpaP family protein n=1 Tax=Ramlibacter sp. TaxID=1917967 RepID=UPI002BC4F7DD|nr:type III secretion HpaP family protein [Ramlibacter sp.]HVZ45039.1 type III secretion HpaP family protein [Ramlibacter sp.]
MSNRRRNIDLGPLYLEVGEEAGLPQSPTQESGADARDVARFESLMRRGGGQGHGGDSSSDATPESLLAPLFGAEAQALADTGDIGDEITHLWVGTGLSSDREVRVGLRETLLPQTSVRLFESEGRLRIEFACETVRVAEWLDRRLDKLARELGERLGRDIELVLSMSDGSVVGEHRWPGAEG